MVNEPCESCVNQRDSQGMLCSLAKLITDTALEWLPRYIIPCLEIESSTVVGACQQGDRKVKT